jgi:hypothetical protein
MLRQREREREKMIRDKNICFCKHDPQHLILTPGGSKICIKEMYLLNCKPEKMKGNKKCFICLFQKNKGICELIITGVRYLKYAVK